MILFSASYSVYYPPVIQRGSKRPHLQMVLPSEPSIKWIEEKKEIMLASHTCCRGFLCVNIYIYIHTYIHTVYIYIHILVHVCVCVCVCVSTSHPPELFVLRSNCNHWRRPVSARTQVWGNHWGLHLQWPVGLLQKVGEGWCKPGQWAANGFDPYHAMEKWDTTSRHAYLNIQTRNFNSHSGDRDLIHTDLTNKYIGHHRKI